MPERDKSPTINDVAERAGVSKRTVSRVINRSPHVNKATRARVEDVSRELNFIPNRQARGLAASRSFLLGLVYDVPTLFINDIQKGILSVCADAGYELVVHACDARDRGLIDDVVRFVDNTHVDGVIILPPVSEIDELADYLEKKGVHYVRFASDLVDKPWKLVVTNYLPAITDMTGHLVELGHRHMGFISGPRDNLSSQKRQETFVEALSRYDLELPESMIAEGAFTYESGLKAGRQLLSRDPRPTAIFAANDEMAFGVMHVADEIGLKIPEDLSLVGFDGTPFSSFVVPALSTIRRQTDEMSRLGTRKLLSLIDEGPDAARGIETMVSPKFVPRQSTGPAPIAQPITL